MDYKDLIRFVPAGSDHAKDVKQTDKNSNNSLTGEEAKTFYEDVISGDKPTLQEECSNRDELCTDAVHKRGKSTQIKKREDGKMLEQTECYVNEPVVTEGSHTLNEDGLEYIHVKQEPCDSEMFTRSRREFCDFSFSERLAQNQDEKSFQRNHQNLLSFAQNGNFQELKRLFKNEKHIDINFQDCFGWTALMCAAVAKQFDVINLLLSKGANKFILNSKGQTVLEVCEEAGAIDAKIVINTHSRESAVIPQRKKSKKFVCDICKREFLECSPEEHKSSTVHLFNLRLKPKSDKYLIPESNKGFQLMKKSGWDGETGLGPSGQGSKYPVKTSLKRDRQCLGSDVKQKTKITHFGARDPDAVKSVYKHSERIMSAKAISKRERKKREQKSKQWETQLRTYMNIDF